MTIARPQFRHHFHVEVVLPKTVYLLSETKKIALTGRLYCWLAPLLNGRHTVDEIVSKLEKQVTSAAVEQALTLLENKGYITEADGTFPPEVAAFWNLLNVDSSVAKARLQSTKVSVIALNTVPKEPLLAALQSLNICISNEQDLTVVLTNDYLQPELATFNQEALRTKKPWILVKPVGAVIWLGPIFLPGQTGCWQCLAHRLRGNREVETAIGQQKKILNPFPTSRSILPSTLQTGLSLAATEIAKWIVTEEHEQLQGKLMTLDLASLNLQHHILVQRPQCPDCGSPDYLTNREPQPLVLGTQKKQFTSDGGHRIFSPEQTLKRYEHLISPITGVVSALERISEDGNDLVHTYVSAHPFPHEAQNLNSLRQVLRIKSAGKGKTDLQSKASAFCEAIERYSGIFTGDEIRVKATMTQLGESAIHPNTLMQFSDAQYQNRQVWNQKHFQFNWMPQPFQKEREIEWTPVWSLTSQTFKYLPTAYLYYNYPLTEDHQFCGANSSGCAAGNTLEEAILQGFMELVERDSVALWWYNRLQRPAVDLASFNNPYLSALLEYYKTLHRELWVLDITSDLNIPAFAAVSKRTDQEAENILFGFGAHFDPTIALLRAVTELNQVLPLEKSVEHNKNLIPVEQDVKSWLATATLANQPYLAPDEGAIPKVLTDYPCCWSDDLRDDVLACVEIAAQQGLEILVLDQTRPDISLNVVKVIVPGLRHFKARFAPGRLYDVPVKLSWLSTPLLEEHLNPIPMFI
ncbi:TOMM precursor leader peptide-binding protein [Nostoc sp.]|uniref:TOMM precursor leader peptide-binding protein n=1 Tax=Nostoc sp. TaxID=1180 RepID=UPI002FF9B496